MSRLIPCVDLTIVQHIDRRLNKQICMLAVAPDETTRTDTELSELHDV